MSLYHKIQISSQNLPYVTGFQQLIIASVFFRFVLGFYSALNTQQCGYVYTTSLYYANCLPTITDRLSLICQFWLRPCLNMKITGTGSHQTKTTTCGMATKCAHPPKCRTGRYKNSCVPSLVEALNNSS